MPKPADITVMTVNLRFGLADDGDNRWSHRKHLMEQLLRRYPADLIGFQESNHFQTEFLSSILEGHHFFGWHNKSIERWQSDPIYYRKDWKCLRHKHRFLSETPEVESRLPGSKWPRQCVIGLFEWNGRQLIMANAHFDFDEPIQQRSAELLLGFLEDFPQNAPVIITGDFNAKPGSSAYTVFTAAGFSEVFENHYTSTFHEFTGKDTGYHIDWILYRGDLAPTNRKIITDSFDGRFPSDHYPVRAGFRFGHPA